MEQEEKQLLEQCTNLLRTLRLSKDNGKVTQETVANAINIHCSSYNMLEKGKRNLYLKEMIRLANFYNIRLSDFAAQIERSPAELDKLQQLQIMLDNAIKENEFLKKQLQEVKV